MSDTKHIYLAGGCFWGVEEYFTRIDGVVNTDVGYANGMMENPTYEQVCSHTTGAAEAVHVEYNPHALPLNVLLDYYFLVVDPTVMNRQGPDVGTQYRTGIYFTDADDLDIIDQVMMNVQMQYDDPLVVEVLPLNSYYSAEEYHQDYLKKNPNGYCHVDFSILDNR